MDIPLNAEVHCTDGTRGHSVCLIINPLHNQVTHVVIKTDGLLGLEYMVPVDRIIRSTPHQIQLRCTRQDLVDMEPFMTSQFVGPEDTFYPSYQGMLATEGSFLWPYTAAEDEGVYVAAEQIPHDELGIHRGAHVEAQDGRIGRVDEFIVNPVNNYITHLVMREGHLWGQREVTIPVAEIQRVEDDVVFLKLDKQAVRALPSLPLR